MRVAYIAALGSVLYAIREGYGFYRDVKREQEEKAERERQASRDFMVRQNIA